MFNQRCLPLLRSAAILASVLLGGCLFKPAQRERSVDVGTFAITPTTVNVGDTFEVSWKTHHSNLAGDIYRYGLFVADPDEVESLEDLAHADKIPQFFTNGPYANDPGKLTCTRTTEDNITCKPFGHLRLTAELKGAHTVSFTACVSYVLATEQTCDSRTATMTFP